MSEPKQYEIDTFKKLINIVNEDNYEAISKDLVLWLGYNVQMMKNLRAKLPPKSQKLSNWDILQSSFVWVDDGKNELDKVRIKDGATGEVTEYTVKINPNKEQP